MKSQSKSEGDFMENVLKNNGFGAFHIFLHAFPRFIQSRFNVDRVFNDFFRDLPGPSYLHWIFLD